MSSSRQRPYHQKTPSRLKKTLQPELPATKRETLRERVITLVKDKTFLLGSVLFFLGVALLSFPWLYKEAISNRPHSKASTQVVKAQEQKVSTQSADTGPIRIDPKLLAEKVPSQLPERIVIPDYKIDLPIVEAKVVNGYWELSETSASHGVGSANPAESGNIVVFAHARENLFGPLHDIKKNTTIYIFTKDHYFRYRADEIKLVDPSQTEVVAPTPTETLTLYTCDGFLDSKRLIVKALPI